MRGAEGEPRWLRMLQPRALERSREGVAFVVVVAVALALLTYADFTSPGPVTVGSFEAVPLLAAGWLLDSRLAAVAVVLAVLGRALAIVFGGVPPATGISDALVAPFLVLVSRVAAISAAAHRESAVRDGLVLRIARITTSAESLDDILAQIVRELARTGMRGGTIALIDEHDRLFIAAADGDLSKDVRAARLPVGQGIMGRVAAQGRPLLVDDMDAPGAVASPTRSLGSNARMRSIVAVPIRAAGRVIGVLELDSSEPARFDQGDVGLLEQIAAVTSGAVQRAGAQRLADEALQRRVRELSVLLDAARSLAATLDLDELARRACEATATIAVALDPADRRAAIGRVAGSRLQLLAEHDEGGGRAADAEFPLADHPGLETAVTERRAVAAPAADLSAERSAVASALGLRSGAFAPITVRGSAWGVLVISSRTDHQFTADELRLLQGVADLVALAIGNSEAISLERTRSDELAEHAARMAALDHAKSEFLRLASHELRGPVAVVRGYLSMLADGSLGAMPEEAAAVMAVLTRKATEVDGLIEQMLETARLEDSRLQLSVAPVDLRDVLVRTAESFRGTEHDAERLSIEMPAGPLTADVDAVRVGTILSNLLDNALKYSPGGGPVEVRLESIGDSATISVRDHGLGIAAADIDRLFTRFGRLVTRENSHIAGTGLGLYLARELARLHGGDITCTSRPGAGSTFVLRLPLTAVPAGPAVHAEPGAAAGPA